MTTNLTLIDLPIPNDASNPFAYAQEQLKNQMYPPFASGFTVRIAILFCLIVYLAIASSIYVFLNMKASSRAGKSLWCFRFVERPDGRYFVLNQHLCFPASAFVMALTWIAYLGIICNMFGARRGDPKDLMLWQPLIWIQLYFHLAATSFAVLAGANVSSSGKRPGTHVLSAGLSNSLYIIMLPCALLAMIGTGIAVGIYWRRFAEDWNTLNAALLQYAAQYNGTVTKAAMQLTDSLAAARWVSYRTFTMWNQICTIVYSVTAAVLIAINVIGGAGLLRTLRNAGSRRTLTDPSLTRSYFSSGSLSSPSTLVNSPRSAESDLPFQTQSGKVDKILGVSAGNFHYRTDTFEARLRRLEWDITLYFFAVVPACIAFIAWSAWESLSMKATLAIMLSGRQMEFLCIGMIWIYAGFIAIAMTIMVVKTYRAEKEIAQPKTPVQVHISVISCTDDTRFDREYDEKF